MIPRLPLKTQRAKLLALYPGSTCAERGGVLTWRGTLQPSPMSRRYVVQIKYWAETCKLDVRVLSPKLERYEGERLPHVYRDGSLCLFYPAAREWTPMKAIADTLVPWASEWLFFYESWRFTGQWNGGGEHPHSVAAKRRLRAFREPATSGSREYRVRPP